MATCVMTTASDVSDSNGGENIWKERAAASGLAKLWNRKLILRDFLKLMCANSLYGGGPKTLLTDQNLLRTNLFFVTETSELRLAGLCAATYRVNCSSACELYTAGGTTVTTMACIARFHSLLFIKSTNWCTRYNFRISDSYGGSSGEEKAGFAKV